jgi:carbon storage regulator
MEQKNMLVLSRSKGESIVINNDIMVTIIDIRGDKVRLGINAHDTVSVHREEVYLAIQRENEKAKEAKKNKEGGGSNV